MRQCFALPLWFLVFCRCFFTPQEKENPKRQSKALPHSTAKTEGKQEKPKRQSKAQPHSTAKTEGKQEKPKRQSKALPHSKKGQKSN